MQANANPAIERLGDDRYRIGTIELNKAAGSFRVPGVVLRDKPPLEYIAVTRKGFKSYESLLELDVTAYEFNIGCVLIGLNPENADASEYHFDEAPLAGDEVTITAIWNEAGNAHELPIGEFVRLMHQSEETGDLVPIIGQGRRADHWIYTGSMFSPQGNYAAQEYGPLISFVHDPATVIGHQAGIGLNQYGHVGTTDQLPPVGTKVTLEIAYKKAGVSKPATD